MTPTEYILSAILITSFSYFIYKILNGAIGNIDKEHFNGHCPECLGNIMYDIEKSTAYCPKCGQYF